MIGNLVSNQPPDWWLIAIEWVGENLQNHTFSVFFFLNENILTFSEFQLYLSAEKLSKTWPKLELDTFTVRRTSLWAKSLRLGKKIVLGYTESTLLYNSLLQSYLQLLKRLMTTLSKCTTRFVSPAISLSSLFNFTPPPNFTHTPVRGHRPHRRVRQRQ